MSPEFCTGILEGDAARRLATIGLPNEAEENLSDCVTKEAALFHKGHLEEADIAAYGRYSEIFHTTLLGSAGSAHLQVAVSQLAHLPAGVTNAIVARPDDLHKEYFRLLVGHLRHCIVLQAIKDGDASRAEAVMREHAFTGAARNRDRSTILPATIRKCYQCVRCKKSLLAWGVSLWQRVAGTG